MRHNAQASGEQGAQPYPSFAACHANASFAGTAPFSHGLLVQLLVRKRPELLAVEANGAGASSMLMTSIAMLAASVGCQSVELGNGDDRRDARVLGDGANLGAINDP